jgi:hypothetical protein
MKYTQLGYVKRFREIPDWARLGDDGREKALFVKKSVGKWWTFF